MQQNREKAEGMLWIVVVAAAGIRGDLSLLILQSLYN
jgi:hypothetical protein